MPYSSGMQAVLRYAIVALLTLGAFQTLRAQQVINLIHADEGTAEKVDNVERQVLKGNVRFLHEGALVFCDSALLFQSTNSVVAYGRVHLKQGDTINAYADTLIYNGNTRIAELFGNIRFFDNDMQMTTTSLEYDRDREVASYHEHARIVSRESRNVLTSVEGYYESVSKRLFFHDSVVLQNPEYNMFSDTLQYDTRTEVAYFIGPTTIVSDSNTIYTENGWYDTRNDLSQFMDRAEIVTKEQVLTGDTLFYDRKTGIGRAFGNVQVTDTTNDFILNGDYAEHFEHREYTQVTGNTLLTQVYEGDSLFLHADTLEAMKDSSGEHGLILAYHKVKFFRSDMQGKCDSMVYTESDSLLTLYHDPVLWSDDNQLTGELVKIKTFEGKIDRIFLYNDAFIISEHDSTAYNQIKGKDMVGFFEDNKLHKIRVEGNGQAMYWVANDKKDSETGEIDRENIGLNEAVCSDMEIVIEDREIIGIYLLNQADGTVHPYHILPAITILDGFAWYRQFRPMTPRDIFIWENPTPPSKPSEGLESPDLIDGPEGVENH